MPALSLTTLDDHELLELRQEAGRILRERNETELIGAVLETIREALAEDGDTREPIRARFSTSQWDNGHFWYADGAHVTLSDGTTEEIESLDLSGAEEALSDHASYQVDPLGSGDTLTITFQPPAVSVG